MHPKDLPTPALMRYVYNRFSGRLFDLIQAAAPDLRPAHGNVLEHLDIQDGLRLTDLAKAAGMTPQSIGEMVDQLELMGYVERRPDPSDRRAKLIYMTAPARKLQKISAKAIEEAEGSIAAALGEKGRDALRRALVKLAAEEDDRTPPDATS